MTVCIVVYIPEPVTSGVPLPFLTPPARLPFPQMAFNASALFAEVEAALAAANASDTLVFYEVGAVITSTLEGPPPAGLLTQLYVQAGILGVELAAVVVSVGCRIWLGSKSRWVFQLRRTRFGTYITPNASFT